MLKVFHRMILNVIPIRQWPSLNQCLALLLVAAVSWPSRGQAAENADVEKLRSELHAALRSANPDYKMDGTFRFKNGKLNSINLMRCKEISDLSPLSRFALETVTSVSLYNATNIADLAPLKGCRLQSLNLERCNKISDLTPLKGMELRWFRMYACSSVPELITSLTDPCRCSASHARRSSQSLSPRITARYSRYLICPSAGPGRQLPKGSSHLNGHKELQIRVTRDKSRSDRLRNESAEAALLRRLAIPLDPKNSSGRHRTTSRTTL